MTTATATAFCAHCGRPVPDDADDKRKGWGIYDVLHGDGSTRTVAVCPACRFGTGRADETHDPGSCGGHYAAPAAYVATCKEWGCEARWACWDKKCVEGWQDEHYVDAMDHDCSHCQGHHNTKLTAPKGKP